MVMAGKKHIPIEVWAPDELNPEYRVRDFGIGLTHEEVVNIYANLGVSTKRGRSDVTGERV